MLELYLGIAGATFFIFAWIYESWEEIHEHKMFSNLKFSYMNFIGVALIIIYSYFTQSDLFFYLNIILIVFIGFEIAYGNYLKQQASKSRRKRKN